MFYFLTVTAQFMGIYCVTETNGFINKSVEQNKHLFLGLDRSTGYKPACMSKDSKSFLVSQVVGYFAIRGVLNNLEQDKQENN